MISVRDKFQELLRELFQFDCADLDFGIYRIMNHKRDVVDNFITRDLSRWVDEELAKGSLAEQSQAAKELKELRQKVLDALGEDALDAEGTLAKQYQQTKAGKEYLAAQEKAKSTRGREALEASIYNHLWSFFNRYYQDGDFISKRRYSKKEHYAIPYNGEEVTLYWANHDQYYIKTGEYFTDYTWKAPNGVTVHFKIKAANVEQGNIKGEKRFFVPCVDESKWDADSKTLTIYFEYRPLNAQETISYGSKNQQENINDAACEKIPAKLSPKNAADALAALGAEKQIKDDTITYLAHHLRQYTKRNTADFFIHKDLKGFLSRELDFYLKNEVLNLEEVEHAGEDIAQSWFQLMRIIKNIGLRIIEFLYQIEEFQKMLWEKRKFITDVGYCITVGNIFEAFYIEIAACEAQWKEWKELFHIDEEATNLFTAGKSKKERRIMFLKEHPTLVLDTKHFDNDFTDRLLASFDDLDEMTDGLLVHSENMQTINLIKDKINGCVSNIFIDPPYNTGDDGFLYKDSYESSSWLAMVSDRIKLGVNLLQEDGVFLASIGDEEQELLSTFLRNCYGKDNFFANLIWEKKKKGSFLSGKIAKMKDYILCVSKNSNCFNGLIGEINTEEETYPCVNAENTLDIRVIPAGIKSKYRKKNHTLKKGSTISAGNMSLVLKSDFVIKDSILAQELIIEGNWRYSQNSMNDYAEKGELYITQDLYLRRIVNEPRYKRMKDLLLRLGEVNEQSFKDYDLSNLDKYGWGTNEDANDELHQILGEQYAASYPKPSKLLTLLLAASRHTSGYWFDYFAGSGTTGHAIINMNRADGVRRKFILVEMADYFNTVLLPRIKKVTFSPEWENGKPKHGATKEEAKRSPRIIKYINLESYEDALNNISFETEGGQQAMQFDDYLLQYMLKWDARKSETLLNVEKLAKPFDYQLNIQRDGETRKQKVNLAETFSYLIGLNVQSRNAYEDKGRYYLVYRGTTRAGQKVVVIWRETQNWKQADYERDRDFIARQKLTEGADEIFVNGDSYIPAAKALETIFKAKMFSPVEG